MLSNVALSSGAVAKSARDWLIEGAPWAATSPTVLVGTCERLIAAGVPIARAEAYVRTLHPQFAGRGFVGSEARRPRRGRARGRRQDRARRHRGERRGDLVLGHARVLDGFEPAQPEGRDRALERAIRLPATRDRALRRWGLEVHRRRPARDLHAD